MPHFDIYSTCSEEIHPTLHPEVCLRLAIEGLNDTMTRDGFVPIILAFRLLPSMPILSSPLTAQQVLMAALRDGSEEIAT